MCILCNTCLLIQAEHYDRTRQQQVDIGLLAAEEAQASAGQVSRLHTTCPYFFLWLIQNASEQQKS